MDLDEIKKDESTNKNQEWNKKKQGEIFFPVSRFRIGEEKGNKSEREIIKKKEKNQLIATMRKRRWREVIRKEYWEKIVSMLERRLVRARKMKNIDARKGDVVV